MSILHRAFFSKSVTRIQDLPIGIVPEVCFIGRSNSGKSTAINAITNNRKLAFSAKRPGRTSMINMFALTDNKQCETHGYLIDLPGYGYAVLPEEKRRKLLPLIVHYILSRKTLVGIILLVDIRRGLTEIDKIFIELIKPCSNPLLVLLSKADKFSTEKRFSSVSKIKNELRHVHSDCIIPFSAKTALGLKKTSQCIIGWVLK